MRRRYALPLAALRFAFPSRVRFTFLSQVRFAFAFGVLLAPGAFAQQAPAEIVPLGTLPITLHLCTLPAGVADHVDHVLPLAPPVPGEQPLATFQVTYSGFSPEAQAAFQYAVDIWAQHIVSSVPIKVQANWTPLGPGVLGSAGSNGLFANFSGAPLTGTWYSNALADALSGQPLDPSGQPGAVEINANFSSTFNGTTAPTATRPSASTTSSRSSSTSSATGSGSSGVPTWTTGQARPSAAGRRATGASASSASRSSGTAAWRTSPGTPPSGRPTPTLALPSAR